MSFRPWSRWASAMPSSSPRCRSAWSGRCGRGSDLHARPRRRDGDGSRLAGRALRALHVLSATDRKPFYYFGVVLIVVGSWIWVALMRSTCGSGRRPIRCAGPLALFCQRRGALALGLDRRGRRARTAATDHSGLARPEDHHRCGARPRVLLLDFARDRLFLAGPELHRLLHDPAARDRGRLYSDTMAGSPSYLFLVVAMPIGIHHVFVPTRWSAPDSSSSIRPSRRWWPCRPC